MSRFAHAALALALVAGCSPGRVQVAWNVAFETPALAHGAIRVVVSVYDGPDCAGTERYTASIANGDMATTTPPPLTAGQYTFCAEAIDSVCNVFATGQTTVDLHGTVQHVDVVLAASAASRACPPGVACADGQCVGADGGGPPDGGGSDMPGVDHGVDGGTDLGVDFGVDMGCPMHFVPMPTAPACDSSTDACLSGCFDASCDDGCIAADSSPTLCRACLDNAYDYCANANGCQASYDVFECCVAGCPVPSSPSCCPTEFSSWDGCEASVQSLCNSAIGICFP